MFSIDRLLTFAAVAFVIIVIPGPSVLFTIGRALTYGRRTAVIAVFGNTSGVYVQALLVTIGLGALVERSILVFTVLELAGAAYLVHLGVTAFRHRRKLSDAMDATLGAPEGISPLRTIHDGFVVGFVVGFANPKAIVFFGAILPQFVHRQAGYVPLQMALLALIFATIALASDCAWGFAAGTARDRFAKSPRRLELVGGAGGLAMIGLGTALAFTGRED
ncbi:LysE family translocator [Actinospica sp.]|uniref:LysE family translocator n=1 Tax=Actinospica sp. TaxID=1872142 RepID=UPI002D0C58C7|nr:LysE family translocator [Actinospica sp.]HWG27957.1 LysE family translocator [Actinospica sp.]